MISCKRATELLSKGLDEKLSLREKIALNVHVRICSYCKEFGENIKSLQRILRLESQATDGEKLPQAKKDQIIDEMKKIQGR